ncbi:membrane protein [Rhodopirellula europaea 6C]|uniref:Membrane protein n=2 Tax=Rhodopirellula TaxID=265488 RepID=M2B6H7_9BACT|nr:membrane protein [Rhodopirellula europaea 6C]
MGNLLPGFLFLAFMWCGVPILACALLGARVGLAPFRWKRIGGAALGLLIGAATLPPASILSVWVAARIDMPPMLPRLIAFIAGGCLASSWVAYVVARIGRPATQVPTIEMLNENCEKLERIIRGSVSEGGLEVGANSDAGVIQAAGILTHDQAVRLEEIRRERNALRQTRTVLHEDVAFWVGKSKELLDELDKQSKRHVTRRLRIVN